MANEAVLLPKEAEGVAGVFGMAVFSQLFACLLSLARGYNPDEPIGLYKNYGNFLNL
jgi:glutamine--fructose-6-phosphate transaminase